MTAERASLGIAIAACLVLLGWNVRLQSQLSDARDALAEKTDAPVNQEVASDGQAARTPGAARAQWREPAAGDRPAQSQAIVEEVAREPSEEEGATEPPEPDWDAVRSEMETATVDVIEAFGTQNGWDRALTDEVLAIYLDTGEAIGDVWTRMHEGETTHYQARKEMREIRDGTTDDLIALIGESAHEAVEEHLWEARREVWQRTPGRTGRPH